MAARPDRRARWPIVLVGLLLLALAGALAAILIPGLPRDRTSQAASPTSSATDVAPSSAPPTEPAPVVPDEPVEGTAWWRIRFDLMRMGPGQVIEVGTLGGGSTAVVEMAMQAVDPGALVFPMSTVIGPAGGLVVTIGQDGPDAVMRSIDAASGEQVEILRTSDVIIDAQFGAGTAIVFLTANPRTGALTGSWLVDAAAAARPEPLEGLVAGPSDIQLVAEAAPFTRLFVSPTGEVAAVQQCGVEGACVIRAVNLDDGSRYEQPIARGDEPIGLGGERMLIRPMCMQDPCHGELLDLVTGERIPLPDAGSRLFFHETVIATPGGAALLTQLTGTVVPMEGPAEVPSFAVTALDQASTGQPVEVALGSMRIVSHTGTELGVELPPGWFIALGAPPIPPGGSGNIPMTAFAIEVASGRVVPLPALGEFFTQG